MSSLRVKRSFQQFQSEHFQPGAFNDATTSNPNATALRCSPHRITFLNTAGSAAQSEAPCDSPFAEPNSQRPKLMHMHFQNQQPSNNNQSQSQPFVFTPTDPSHSFALSTAPSSQSAGPFSAAPVSNSSLSASSTFTPSSTPFIRRRVRDDEDENMIGGKRARTNGNDVAMMESKSPTREDGPFPAIPFNVDDMIDTSTVRPKKSNPRSSPPSTELYTAEQVRRIVADALQKREQQLRDEYNVILNDLLREQFENFSSFNRDYVSRQLSKNDFSYLS